MKPAAVMFGANYTYAIKGTDPTAVTNKGRELWAQHPGTFMQMGFTREDFDVTVYQFVDDFSESTGEEEAYQRAKAEGNLINVDA